MKKYIFFIVLIFCFSVMKAQNNWEPGYIILKEKDSVSGFILESTDADLANHIKFKKEVGQEFQVFEAGDIAGFGFLNGRIYETQSFVEENGANISVFAKNLVRGKVDLFAWRHPQRLQPDFFLVNNGSGKKVYLKKPVKREIIGKDLKRYNHRDKKYIGNLKLIKEDSLAKSGEIRFSEKLIQKDIIQYNNNYINDFPLVVHEERIDYSFDVMAGVPIQFATGLSNFRVALYVNRTKPERSDKFIFTRGIIYNHYFNDRSFPAAFRNGTMNNKAQMLNLVPFAIKFQGNSKIFQPYGYAGGGFAVIKATDLLVKDFQDNGTETNFYFLPTANLGIGARLQMGPGFLVAEVTPTLLGIFLNTGISF